MDISTLLFYIVFSFLALVLFLNLIKVFINIFSTQNNVTLEEELESLEIEENPLIAEVRLEIDEQVRPHLTSLEGMYEKSNTEEKSLAAFVFSVFKDKFSSHIEKDTKIVEAEIGKCCSEYEGADCKESFCLEGSGLSCPK